jgi:polar amino acid transport system substrate-binding protein
MKFFTKKIIVLLVAVMSLSLWYFFFQDKRVVDYKNTLIVGVSPDYPPFEFIENEEIVGFDIDLIKALGNEMGKEIEIKDMEFSALIPSLNTGKVDAIISGLSGSDERSGNMWFSIPYYKSSLSVITKADANITSFEDFPPNSKLGVQTGTTMEWYINEFNKGKDEPIEVMSMGSNFVLIAQLKLGKIDGVIVEKAQSPSFVKNSPNLTFFEVKENQFSENGKSYVIGVKKGSKLIVEINEGIEKLKSNGKMKDLLEKWNLN